MQRRDRSWQSDASTEESSVMCDTPPRHGAYAALSCPCNWSVTSSLALAAPRCSCYPRQPCAVCVIVSGELKIRINPRNLDACLAKRSFQIRTINSYVRVDYVFCCGGLCRGKDGCARTGSAATCVVVDIGGRAERCRNGGGRLRERSPRARGMAGAQMAASPSTKSAKPTRCNRTKVPGSCLGRVFLPPLRSICLLPISLLAYKVRPAESCGPGRA